MEEETRYQIAIAIGGVLVFVAAAAVVGTMYGVNGEGVNAMTSTGGLALVGTIVFFILVMAGAGVWLDSQEFDS
jgi:peptidoglycan/LPS O-acetylase OafA/YrhL